MYERNKTKEKNTHTRKHSRKHSQKLAALEEDVRVQTKRKQIETAILGSVSIIGMVSIVVLAPNVIQVLHKAFPDVRSVSQKQSVRRAINRLIKNGFLKKENGKYRLTRKGEERFHENTTLSAMAKRKQKWDKKWRIVIYDIPEKQRDKRNELRNVLLRIGFLKLQDSVWVYPFRCDEVVALIKFKLKLGRRAVYVIADAIENDEWVKKYFHLS